MTNLPTTERSHSYLTNAYQLHSTWGSRIVNNHTEGQILREENFIQESTELDKTITTHYSISMEPK